jgi:hypothetical protein
MAKKTLRSAADAAEDQLKAGAKRIRGQLAPVEKAVEGLASRAKGRLPAAAGVTARAKDAVARRRARGRSSAPTPVMTPPAAAVGPDESWTVSDLRAEAKKRGLTGYSRKSKAELLAQLRG